MAEVLRFNRVKGLDYWAKKPLIKDKDMYEKLIFNKRVVYRVKTTK